MKLRVRLARPLREIANRLDNEGLPIQVGYSYTLTTSGDEAYGNGVVWPPPGVVWPPDRLSGKWVP
jgi:hypothetical protein